MKQHKTTVQCTVLASAAAQRSLQSAGSSLCSPVCSSPQSPGCRLAAGRGRGRGGQGQSSSCQGLCSSLSPAERTPVLQSQSPQAPELQPRERAGTEQGSQRLCCAQACCAQASCCACCCTSSCSRAQLRSAGLQGLCSSREQESCAAAGCWQQQGLCSCSAAGSCAALTGKEGRCSHGCWTQLLLQEQEAAAEQPGSQPAAESTSPLLHSV